MCRGSERREIHDGRKGEKEGRVLPPDKDSDALWETGSAEESL